MLWLLPEILEISLTVPVGVSRGLPVKRKFRLLCFVSRYEHAGQVGVERVLGKTAIARHDPLLSNSLPGLTSYHEDDDVLDIGLDVQGLSEDEQEPLSSGQHAAAAASIDQVDTSFLSLCCRAAEKLDVDWPSTRLAQKPSRFSGFFLPPERLSGITCLCSLILSRSSPDMEQTTVYPRHGARLWTVFGPGWMDGAEKAGLVNPPPMEASLAPAQNHGVSGPTMLPSKHCRFSASQLEKIYRTQATMARALSYVSGGARVTYAS